MAILLFITAVVCTALLGIAGAWMYLLSQVLRGSLEMTERKPCAFCQRQRERWLKLVAKIRGSRK